MSRDFDYRYLSNAQYYSFIMAGIVSGSLSMFGSCTILYLILRTRHWRKSVYQRIMFGQSFCDLISSLSIPLAPFMVPSDTDLPVDIGNKATCQAGAFLLTTGIGTHYYSAALSIYFLLVIRYGWSEMKALKRLEPWIHVIPWRFPLATNIAALHYDILGPDPVMNICTPVCERDQTTGDCLGSRSLLTDHVYGGVLLACFVSLSCTWCIYVSVYRQELSTQRHSASTFKQSKAVAGQAIFYTAASANSVVFSILTNFVGTPATLSDRERTYIPVQLLFMIIFIPLQGFFNWIVYCRPNYLRWRRRYPEKTRWWSYQQVLTGRSPTQSQPRRRNSPTACCTDGTGFRRSTDTVAVANRRENPSTTGEIGSASCYASKEKENDTTVPAEQGEVCDLSGDEDSLDLEYVAPPNEAEQALRRSLRIILNDFDDMSDDFPSASSSTSLFGRPSWVSQRFSASSSMRFSRSQKFCAETKRDEASCDLAPTGQVLPVASSSLNVVLDDSAELTNASILENGEPLDAVVPTASFLDVCVEDSADHVLDQETSGTSDEEFPSDAPEDLAKAMRICDQETGDT